MADDDDEPETPGHIARRALEHLIERLPGGEQRDGQLDMCEAAADALASGEHLVVEAGTGVGKSLAYLVAAVLSGQRIVIATARRPLQDQLIRKDIPFVAASLPGGVDAAVLKGRSNYLCLAKLAEATGGNDGQAQLIVDRRRPALDALRRWADETESGDLADVPATVTLDSGLRSLVTVTSRECPGAASCDYGERCLAERALERAREAQLVVTNMDVYCLDVGIGGGLLGPHDAVVFDEAHELEAIASRSFGLEIGARRFGWLAGQVRGLLTAGSDEPTLLERAGEQLEGAFTPAAGGRVNPTAESLAPAMAAADDAVSQVVDVLRKIPAKERKDGRRDRCLQAASSLLEDVRRARTPGEHDVAWIPDSGPASLLIAPVDVGPELARLVFTRRTAILTSATLSVGGTVSPMARRLGLGRDETTFRELRVGSPFDYWNHAVLYCPVHLPDPRRMPKSFDDDAIEELAGLVEAAGGRTLALFTSHRMLRRAAEALRDRFAWKVYVQDGPPEPGLIERFRDDETSCLLATMGYWQGVDVPGRSLSLVVIDRLPFASPKDPLLEARRDLARQAGEDSFQTVDLPIAATLLAQGAGRLIRTTTDRGVVAVLDRRLATAGYKHALLDSLPPLRRSIDGAEVRALLAALADGREPPPVPARRPRPRRTSGEAPVTARVGLAVGLGEDRRVGAVTELLPHGAVVELDGGEVVVVPWGRQVVVDGEQRLLAAPDRTMSGSG